MARLAEESSEERTSAKKGFFPSSIGLSFRVFANSWGARWLWAP